MLTPWTRRRRAAEAEQAGRAEQQQLALRAIRQTLAALGATPDPGPGPSVLSRQTSR